MIRRLLIATIFTGMIGLGVAVAPSVSASNPKEPPSPIGTVAHFSLEQFALTIKAHTPIARFHRLHHVAPVISATPVTTTTVAPVVAPPPAPVVQAAPVQPVVAQVSDNSAIWQCIISHESGGDPAAVNPSSGAGGLFQFLPSSWATYGGTQYAPVANLATPDQQWAIAISAQAQSGWYPWVGDGCTPVG